MKINRKNRRRWILTVLVLLLTMTWAFSAASAGSPVDLLVLDDTGSPVSGVEIKSGGDLIVVTGDDGKATIGGRWRGRQIDLSAPGFLTSWIWVPKHGDSTVTAQIDPAIFRGKVVDPFGRPVSEVQVKTTLGAGVTNAEGEFAVRRAEPGDIEVFRPAWVRTDTTWDGSPGSSEYVIAPRKIKSIHVAGDVLGDQGRWNSMLMLVRSTELNAITLDLKDDWATIFYDSDVSWAQHSIRRYYDLESVATALEAEGIYLIGRIVAFQDPVVAKLYPEMAVWDASTGAPYHRGGQYFLDPTDADAREYVLQLAEEACDLGVDEIQLDYIRFPDGRPENARYDGEASSDTARNEAIGSLFREAKARLHPKGCALAADVFGFMTTARDDGGIGQSWKMLTAELDVVSPMLYPSHFGKGWAGIPRPVDEPYRIVYGSIDDGLRRQSQGAVIRPWLQDFGYGTENVRAQIDAAEAHDLGWMLWNIISVFHKDALLPAEVEADQPG